MIAGPWFLTPTAVREFMAITRWRGSFGDAQRELARQAEATLASGRVPRETDSGALRYRGPSPLRLQLLVMPSHVEGRLPQLVKVLRSHGAAG